MAVGAPTDIIIILIGTIVFCVALARVVTLIAERPGTRSAARAPSAAATPGAPPAPR